MEARLRRSKGRLDGNRGATGREVVRAGELRRCGEAEFERIVREHAALGRSNSRGGQAEEGQRALSPAAAG